MHQHKFLEKSVHFFPIQYFKKSLKSLNLNDTSKIDHFLNDTATLREKIKNNNNKWRNVCLKKSFFSFGAIKIYFVRVKMKKTRCVPR